MMWLKSKIMALLVLCCLNLELMSSIRRVSTGFVSKGTGTVVTHRLARDTSALLHTKRYFGVIEVASSVGAAVVSGLSGKLVLVGLKAGFAALGQDKIAEMLVRKYPFLRRCSGWIGTSIITMLVMHIDKIADDESAKRELLEQWQHLTEEMHDAQNKMDEIAGRSDLNSFQKKILTEKLQAQFENKFKIWLTVLPETVALRLHQELEEEQMAVLRQKIVSERRGWRDFLWGDRDISVDIAQALEQLDAIAQSNKEKASHAELIEGLRSATFGSDPKVRAKELFNRTERLMEERRREELVARQKAVREAEDDLWHLSAPSHE